MRRPGRNPRRAHDQDGRELRPIAVVNAQALLPSDRLDLSWYVPDITLRQRIADALTKPSTSAEVRACIAHLQADLARVDRERQRAEAAAVDPLASDDGANEAKREFQNLTFDLERLTASEIRLKARLEGVTNEEAEATRRHAYDTALAERDEIAAKLAARYPVLAAEMAEILGQVQASDARVKGVNADLPAGADRLAGPERIARGEFQHPSGTYTPPEALVSSVRLPAFGTRDAFLGQEIWHRPGW
jgi:hypothetical protein